jgi:1-acyl-sn-glycerol-3-phosphate acyltransferase
MAHTSEYCTPYISSFSALSNWCALWRTFGCPESGRLFLRGLWQSISRIFIAILGCVKIEFQDELDPDERFVVANRGRFLDGWLFAGYDIHPLGKKELLSLPFVGDVAELYDATAVDRARNSGITKLLIDNAKDPSKPAIVMISEGVSTSGDYMLRFHLGMFLSDLPVQLVAIRHKLCRGLRWMYIFLDRWH